MNELFIQVLNMSLGAGCAALIVMLVRLLLKRVPKIYSYILWAAVFFRLICPLTIQLPMTSTPVPVPIPTQTIPRDILHSESPSIQSGVSAIDKAVNTAIERGLSPAASGSVSSVQTALEIGAYLWLAGIFALLLYGILSYLYLKRRVMTAIRVQDNVYETDLIKTPFVLGLLRAKIYVPTGLSEKEFEYVIAHEQTHIRRRDYRVKLLAFFIACIHWFNPLIWISYFLMTRDMELSADESVMKRYGTDIRNGYSNSLLSLSVKRSGLFSPLAFGEIGVKERVKNVLHYKKPAFWVSVAAIIIVAAVSLSLIISKQLDMVPDPLSNSNKGPDSTPEMTTFSEYNKVEIEFLSENKGFKPINEFKTTDAKIVTYIDSAIAANSTPVEQDDLVNNHTNQYTIKLSNKIGGYSCQLYYDTLYDKAYLAKDGGLYEIGTDFARYIDSLFEHASITTDTADSTVTELFDSYGWTIDYRINVIKGKLKDIDALSGFDPNTYYFAYNNELSKDIGLDMGKYSNSSGINIGIYRVHESMPPEFYPIQDARGIVVKENKKIIGAFISAGRHSTFNACSLKGNSFETATGQTLGQWLADKIKANNTEKKLSRLTPEQIIGKYFEALDKKDAETAGFCISKRALLGSLTQNMADETLYNKAIALPLTDASINANSNFDNLKSAKLLKAELLDSSSQDTKTFRVYVDLQYRKEFTIENGEQYWDCDMVYESPQTGWKIEGFGH